MFHTSHPYSGRLPTQHQILIPPTDSNRLAYHGIAEVDCLPASGGSGSGARCPGVSWRHHVRKCACHVMELGLPSRLRILQADLPTLRQSSEPLCCKLALCHAHMVVMRFKTLGFGNSHKGVRRTMDPRQEPSHSGLVSRNHQGWQYFCNGKILRQRAGTDDSNEELD